jgi:hypothetical protein
MPLTKIIAVGLLIVLAVGGCSPRPAPTNSRASEPPPATQPTQPTPTPPQSERETPTTEPDVTEGIGFLPVPDRVITTCQETSNESRSAYVQKWVILWPRLAGLLTQSVLGVKEESMQVLNALPGCLEETTKHYDPTSSSVWLAVAFSPTTVARLPDGPKTISELLLYAEQPGEATLFVRTKNGWLSYATITTSEEIQQYMKICVEALKKASDPPPAIQPSPTWTKSEQESPADKPGVIEAIGYVPVPIEVVTPWWGATDKTKSTYVQKWVIL